MKKIVPLFFVMFAFVQCRAGWDISFCEELDSSGKCPAQNSVFNWGGEIASITIMVSNEPGLGTSKLSFKIFDMKNDHTGEVYAEMRTSTKAEWTFATKKVPFVKPGYYKVEVYDQDNNRLVYNFLTVTERN